jgi:hypothetical protein
MEKEDKSIIRSVEYRRKYSNMNKGAKDMLAGSAGKIGGG